MSRPNDSSTRADRVALRDAPGMKVLGGAFEVRKTGASKYDFSDPYYLALSLSWPAFALAALGVLLAINLVFAALYLASPGCVTNLPEGSLAYALFFSLETLATVGYGEMAPATFYGHTVAAIEIFLGMALVAVMTGLLFVRFSRPKPRILFADTAVIGPHDGRLTMMIRIANGRMTPMSSARAELGALIARTTAEGDSFRSIYELSLVRSSLAFFPLTWTLMHVIDDDSPLAGYDQRRLVDEDVRLFLTIRAMDDSLNSEVRSMQGFDSRTVRFGARYSDAVSVDDQGRTIADLSRLSFTEDA